MIEKKPTILIYTFQPEGSLIREICAGMEEEGVFYELIEYGDSVSGPNDREQADRLAWQAAQDSMLGSGIGVSRTCAARQMKGLEPGHSVESYQQPTAAQSRKLGANSARAIKKMPFR